MRLSGEALRDSFVVVLIFILVVVIGWSATRSAERTERRKCKNGFQVAHTAQDTLFFVSNNPKCLQYLDVNH